MSNTYLVFRQTGSSYSFRSIVPKDLQSLLGTKEFQLSLRCGILKQAKLLSSHLYNLSQLSAKFITAKNEAGYLSKTINGYHDTHKLAISVLGNMDINSLTHDHGRRLVSILKKLPVNRGKSYSNLTIQKLLQLENEPTLSHKTILKHTERISALFNWAINQGYTSQNVFRGKLEPIRKVETVEKHFTDQELNLILGNALKTESLAKNKPERY